METPSWRHLCGLSIKLVGSQEAFRKEAAILKRLVKKFGPQETERCLIGAQLMGWTSLRSLGSADGLGRRMASAAYWRHQEKHPAKLPDQLKTILRGMLT